MTVAPRNSTSGKEELRQFIERIERLDAEAKDIADMKKEVFAEAKGRGYDTKAMRVIISERKKDPNDLAEHESIVELYRMSLGMGGETLGYTQDGDEEDDAADIV